MVQEIKPETPTPLVTTPLQMTYEEFLEWATQETHFEWVKGKAIPMGTVSKHHARVGRFLLGILLSWVEAKQLGEIYYDPFQMKTAPHLPGRSPDILFVKTENLSRLKKNHLAGPADLVIEIISPESRSRDRGEKYSEYEEGGVAEYWLVDPVRKQAEFYHRDETGIYQRIAVDETGIFRSRELAGLWLKVAWLWQEPTPAMVNVMKEWGLI